MAPPTRIFYCSSARPRAMARTVHIKFDFCPKPTQQSQLTATENWFISQKAPEHKHGGLPPWLCEWRAPPASLCLASTHAAAPSGVVAWRTRLRIAQRPRRLLGWGFGVRFWVLLPSRQGATKVVSARGLGLGHTGGKAPQSAPPPCCPPQPTRGLEMCVCARARAWSYHGVSEMKRSNMRNPACGV